jgi:adenylate cyclase
VGSRTLDAVPTPEEFEAAGLFDPADDTVVGRLDLLNWLAEAGFSIEEMQHALTSGSLSALAGDRFLVPGERIERDEAVAMSGLSPEVFEAYSRAFGFDEIDGAPAGDVRYTADEVALFRVIESLASVFSRDEAVALVRVVGTAVERIAEAAVSLFLVDVESPHIMAGRSELELGRSVFQAVQLVDGLAAQLDPLLRRHVLQAIERARATTIDSLERFQYRYAVGFVDLVGYTSLSGNLTAQELARFIGRFEAQAHDVVADAGARVVKLIGDEVMFVATDADAACRAGLALIDAFSGDRDVQPRGGLAYGSVVLRGGDYYGSVVNLASRLADAAVPGELLVSSAVVEAATACDFEPAGRRMIKGFDGSVPVWSLSRVR